MRNYFYATIFICLLISCSNSPEDSTDQILPIERDTTDPELSIAGLQDVIEVITSITISVTDESNNVTTVVLIDGQELIRTEDKEFSIEIDPFDYSNGNRTITVESTDSNDNQSSLSKSFELKKLLFVYSDIQILSFLDSTNAEFFVSLNKLNGDLIEYRKIDKLEENRFYAIDGFERQNFVASLFIISTDLPNRQSGIITYADIRPGSITQTANQVTLQNTPSKKTDSFKLTMTDANGQTNFYAGGKDYSLGIFGKENGNFESNVLFDPDTKDEILIFSNPDNVNNLDFYKYLFIDDFGDKTLSFSDLTPLGEYKTLNLPFDVSDYSLSFSGYRNEDAYKNNKFNSLFRKNQIQSGTYSGQIDVPIFNNFEVYSKSFSAGLSNNRRFYSRTKGFSEVTIPNWTASVVGNEVITFGDYDNIQISATFRGTLVGNTKNFMSWTYRRKNNQQFDMPFENFEIPGEIKEMLQIAQIDPNDPSQLLTLGLTLQDFEINVDIEKGIFVGFGENQYGDEESMRFTIMDGIGI